MSHYGTRIKVSPLAGRAGSIITMLQRYHPFYLSLSESEKFHSYPVGGMKSDHPTCPAYSITYGWPAVLKDGRCRFESLQAKEKREPKCPTTTTLPTGYCPKVGYNYQVAILESEHGMLCFVLKSLLSVSVRS